MYVKFEDPEVERICVKELSSDGYGCTTADLASATILPSEIMGNDKIVTFNELQYFTGLTKLFPNTPETNQINTLRGCINLRSIRFPMTMQEQTNLSINEYNFRDGELESLVDLGTDTFPQMTRIGQYAFSSLPLLEGELHFPNLFTNTRKGDRNGIFCRLGKITKISLGHLDYIGAGSLWDTDYRGAFCACPMLETIDMGDGLTYFGFYNLRNSPKIKNIIWAMSSPPNTPANNWPYLEDGKLSGNDIIPYTEGMILEDYFGSNTNFTLWVPDETIALYKEHYLWKYIVSHIKPLSEYSEE